MSEAQVLADILRVDHAGEVGAIRIYGAQIAVARRRAPDLVPVLIAAREDEIAHRDFFAGELGRRGIVPCHMLGFWWSGGMVLGLVTALLGRGAGEEPAATAMPRPAVTRRAARTAARRVRP